jgi:hypothetical protein
LGTLVIAWRLFLYSEISALFCPRGFLAFIVIPFFFYKQAWEKFPKEAIFEFFSGTKCPCPFPPKEAEANVSL